MSPLEALGWPAKALRKGSECSRGLQYEVHDSPVASGTPGQVRKFSSGRKGRGMASGPVVRLERPKEANPDDVAGVLLNRWGV